MTTYKYTKLNNGNKQTATIQASSPTEARKTLRAQGVQVLELTTQTENTEAKSSDTSINYRKIKQRDISAATRQLATLLKAGVPLVPALTALTEQYHGQPLEKIFAPIQTKVNQGISLESAMSDYPAIFSEVFTSMIRAGEATGTLENVLLSLAEMTERRTNLTNKVKAAMAYPIFMAVTGFGVIAFIFAFVIPGITKLFIEMNRQLPLPTIILINLSDFLSDFWLPIIAIIIAAIIALKFYSKTTNGRKHFDTLKLKLPLFGPMNTKIALSRFSRTLAVLLSSGLSIVETLDLAKNVIGNSIIATAAENAKESITRGISIADSFKQTGVFPPVVIHMIDAGEKSGGIEEGLTNIANAYDNDVEAITKALTSMLEPAMIVIFGLITGLIVLAVLLPIFEINQAIV